MRWLFLFLALPVAAQDRAVLDRLYDLDETEGIQTCVPRGALAALIGESPACTLDFNACDLALTLARGEPAPADQVAVLLDLVRWSEAGFAAQCPGDGPRFLHQTGIKGLASLGDRAHVGALLALTEPEALEVIGENPRRLLAEALHWLGDATGAAGLARLAAYGRGNPDFRATAVLGLAALGDPAVGTVCAAPMADARVEVACLEALATVRAPEAWPRLEAAAAAEPEAVARALGTLGDARAVPLLKRLAASGALSTRLAAQVSLLALGDETYLGSLVTALQGPEKAARDRFERARKKPRATPKRKPKRHRDGRVRRMPKPKPMSPKALAALAKEVAALELAAQVATECGRLVGPNERLDKALWIAARRVNDLRPAAHTAALVALAQRGDHQAIQEVAALLTTTADPVRGQLLAGVGAYALEPWLPGRGRGVVAHTDLLPALATLADDAETQGLRSLVLRALRNVRRALAP